MKELQDGTFKLNIKDKELRSYTLSSLAPKVKLLYFSASWCPPCREFTPKLAKWYNKINESAKRVEVVFVSRDRDEE